MSIPLNKDFRELTQSIIENVAIPSRAKEVIRYLVKVIDEYDGSEMSDSNVDWGHFVIADATKPEVEDAPAPVTSAKSAR